MNRTADYATYPAVMAWDPTQYLRFESQRLRPAVELLQRVRIDHPARVVDLGCGTGNTTTLLTERWPEAHVVGVDNSSAMLAVAEHDHPDGTWVQSSIDQWVPDAPFDVVYSNAALHWLDDHAALLPRLLAHVSAGGTFAMQVPDNFSEPTHQAAIDIAREGPWAEVLSPLIRPWPVLQPTEYARLLEPHCDGLDVWATTYVQVLTGDNPVAQWTKGAALRPYLSALDDGAADAFFAAYAARILAAYPPEPDGTTLLPFRRVFVVATER
jgi:trans-aconitate 2-methyltransferase